METQKPIRLTKLPKSPVAFLPVMITPMALRQDGVPPYSLILVRDEDYEPRLGSHLIEIAQTMEQAQTLLEFYLMKSHSQAVVGRCTIASHTGMVVPLRLEHVFAWMLKMQVALPVETQRTVKGIFHQVGIAPRVRYYLRRPWRDIEMGKVPFNLVGVHDPDERRRLDELVDFLKSKSSIK